MKKVHRVKKWLGCILGIAMLLGSVCVAAGNEVIVETTTGESDIAIYVKDMDFISEDISVQIGTAVSETVTCQRVEELPMQTLVLLDNSLSVPSAVRPKIAELLQDLIGDRAPKEEIALAVFDEEIIYLTDYTNDYATLKNSLEQITYEDQETYLTDVLYDLLATQDVRRNQDAFWRIIILSDGVDNKSLGYTKEELYSLIKENSYPIYTIGCQTGNNNEQLESMFALSRLSKAESFLLDESDTLTILNRLKTDRNIVKVNVELPAQVMDGSRKAVKLCFQGTEVSCEMKMPQKAAEIQEVEETASTIEEEPETIESVTQEESSEEIETESEEVPEEESNQVYQILFWVIIGCIVLIVVVIIVLCVIMMNQKKKKQQEQTRQFMSDRENALNNALVTQPVEDEKTLLVNAPKDREESNTLMMWNQATMRYLILTDVRVPAKSFQVPFQGKVIIGRKKELCQLVVDYDMSVSSKHCEVVMRNQRIFVRDLQSSNGTFVNGTRILGETEIVSGCLITLGRLEMKLEIR